MNEKVKGSSHLNGICQNMDGNQTNDWAKCFGFGPTTDFAAIADSCRDGDNDGLGYVGGTKLDGLNQAQCPP